MIKQAEKEFNIDLKNSYFIGDSSTDIQTGSNAGIETFIVSTGYGGKDRKYKVIADNSTIDLKSAVNMILDKSKKIR